MKARYEQGRKPWDREHKRRDRPPEKHLIQELEPLDGVDECIPWGETDAVHAAVHAADDVAKPCPHCLIRIVVAGRPRAARRPPVYEEE